MRERLRDALLSRLERQAEQPFMDAPFGRTPRASAAEYRRLWEHAKAQSFPAIDAFESESGAAIDQVWLHQLALLTQVTIKASDLCYQHGRLLYAVLSRYVRAHQGRPLTIVETGTARGFSGLCLAKALADQGAAGTILSFDVLPHDVAFLWNCVLDEQGPRTRAQLLGDYTALIERHLVFLRGDTKRELSRVSMPRVHMAVLDSVHTYDHVHAEFATIGPRQQTGDVLFFDDYTPDAYPGVVKAADEICAEHGYRTTVITANPRRRYLIAEKQ